MSQLLMLSQTLPETHIPCFQGLWGGGGRRLCVPRFAEKFPKFFDKKYAVPRYSGRIRYGPCILCIRGTIMTSPSKLNILGLMSLLSIFFFHVEVVNKLCLKNIY